MKKSTLLLFALFTMLWQVDAQVTIGAGNLQAENAPFEPFYGYSYSQTVYLASEINANGDISDIQWYYSGTSALPSSQELVIYMAELPRTEFASTTDWEPIASFTEVYSGGITVTAGVEGWVTLTLDTPFTYAGTGNLVIAVEENGADYDDAGDDFYNSQVTTNRTISYFSDGTNPDPTTPPTASNIDDTIPNIVLGGITQACPNPTDLSITGITANEAVFSWTEVGGSTIWNVEIVEAGATPTGMPTATNVPNPYTVSGLDAITGYDIYVQSDCGAEQSSYSGPISFSTLCDVFIPDYLEDFSAFPVDCWEEADSGDATTGPMDIGETFNWIEDGWLDVGTTGAYSINLYQGGVKSDWIISPQFDLTGGPFQVEFDIAILDYFSDTANNLGSDDTVQLLITNDNGITWTNLYTYDNTSVVPQDGERRVLNLTTYSGQIVQFAILASDGTADDTQDNNIFIDNFQVRNVPSCPEPSDMMVSSVTSDSAILDWVAGDIETAWIIEYNGGADFTPGNGEEEGSVAVNPLPNTTLTSLSPATTYYGYYQSNCGVGDLSTWIGPFTFTTECVTFIAPYTEGFENAGDIPLCWSMDGGEDWEFADDGGFDNIGNGGTLTGSTATNNFFAWVDASGDDGPSTLTSPFVDVTGLAAPALSFYEISDNQGSANSNLVVEVWDGAAWNTMGTFNTNTVGWELKILDLSTLTITGDVQARFIFSETVTGDFTDDIAIDDVTFDEAPSCFAPTMLTANNLSLTSTELGWTEAVPQTSWNIEYDIAGFAQGTGTIEAGVTTNPYILTSLTPDTSYEFYVQAICGPGDESPWAGPYSFFTGYCESLPTSNDGNGVGNVTIGTVDFPSFGDEFYENHTTPVVNVFQGINTAVEILFEHTYTYGTNIWIDFNDNLIFDTDELVFQGESAGGNNPHLLDASFVMPLTAAIGEHRMRIGTADFGQATPDPCYSGSWGVTLDFTVNIQELNCTLAEANYTTVPDCATDQFYIDVNITSLGDATSLEISNNFDTGTLTATILDTYQAGPFPFGTAVKVFVTNIQDTDCVISSETFEVLACPPSNDECAAAAVAVVNDGPSCDQLTSGTILAATPSGVDGGSCTGTPNDDVWFTFTAMSEVQIISIINITGGTSNLNHAVYEGSCGSLTELYCSDDESSVTTELVVGNTYTIRVFSSGSVSETSVFDLCIRAAPNNLICENAENFCSVGGALTTPNIIGIPSTGQVACLGSIPNPTWNIIQVGESGPIEIQIEQTDDSGNGLDVDFVIWGPFVSVEDACIEIVLEDCPTCPFSNNPDNGFYPFGNIVDCSYSGSSIENLTIPNAQTDEIYLLLVTNFNGGAGNITIEQTNAGGTDNGTIEAEITAEITNTEGYTISDTDNNPATPDELNACSDSIILDLNSPFADEYVWFEDGFVIPDETSSTLTVPAGGFGLGLMNYQVKATDNQCGSEAYSQIVIVNLYSDPDPVAPQTITLCDGPEADGTESFDLDELSNSLGLTGFTVRYYTNANDANSTQNPVASPYSSTGETLIMRIEDTDQIANPYYFGCRYLSSVELVVNPALAINQPDPLVVCDDLDGIVDGITEFDLTSINSEITADTSLVITYHTSQDDADAGTADVTSTTYSSNGETLFVRATDTTTGCYATTSFNLVINVVPLADFDPSVAEYQVCPNATVPISIDIIPSNFDAADVSVSWTLDGASIPGSGLSLTTVLVAGDYEATITFNDTGCVNTVSTSVIELESCV
ncbi:fibronectin type III domain protein, partial [Winogradskyella eximia]